MNILGINAYHGDAAACITQDGVLTAACEEERLRRIKHCAGFPRLAIQMCLNQTGLTLDEIDAITISRNPKANLIQKMVYVSKNARKLSAQIKNRLANALKITSIHDELERTIFQNQSLKVKIYQVEHHLAHMASCFFPSPFEEAAILSIDGFGDFVSTKWGVGKGTSMKVLGQVKFPHSIGIFYTAITQYLGFLNYGDEYKVMGLAAYGKPSYVSQFQEIITCGANFNVQLNLSYFTHHSTGVEMNWEEGYPYQSPCYSQKLIELLGSPRHPESPLTDRDRDLAASLQHTFEEIYFGLLNQLYVKTKKKDLCLAGGCALNSAANGKIFERTPFKNVFVQPAAGDAGTALGSALYTEHVLFKNPRRFQMRHTYFGPEFNMAQIKKTLTQEKLHYEELGDEEIVTRAAQALADGKIVGWFQGQMEFGPRALGNRSLLADPRRAEMKAILNERIKHREEFRPFAPSVLEEEAHHFFEPTITNPFMTQVMKVKLEKRKAIPSVTHFDGTARVHTVNREVNPKYWALIHAFGKLTGVPIILNTSFNENEPIVCTPENALNCFSRSRMDYLALGNFWFENPSTTFTPSSVTHADILAAQS